MYGRVELDNAYHSTAAFSSEETSMFILCASSSNFIATPRAKPQFISRICRLAPTESRTEFPQSDIYWWHRALSYCVRSNIIYPAKMSRFFTQGDSSSESSSSDEEELYSDNEGEQKSEEEESDEEDASEDEASSSSDEGGKSGVSKFLRDVASSDESEDEDKVTIVKSAKDKRLEELEGVVKIIDNAVKINDWSSIATGELQFVL